MGALTSVEAAQLCTPAREDSSPIAVDGPDHAPSPSSLLQTVRRYHNPSFPEESREEMKMV